MLNSLSLREAGNSTGLQVGSECLSVPYLKSIGPGHCNSRDIVIQMSKSVLRRLHRVGRPNPSGISYIQALDLVIVTLGFVHA